MHRVLETLRSSLGLLWTGVDFTRRLVLNALFLVILLALVGMIWFDDGPEVEKGSALVVKPSGLLVEQVFGEEGENAVLSLLGRGRSETLMSTLLEAIERAATDDRIEVLVLDLNRLAGGGLSKTNDLRDAVEAFRSTGKTVIATSDSYAQSQYLLAASADEVFLHPMGMVLLTGYGSYRNYYKDALDFLGVNWNVFKVGEYKSAPEPYTRNDMSAEAREARLVWLTALWTDYKRAAAESRGLEPAAIDEYVESFHESLARHDGSAAEVALAAGLVDRIASRDELRDRLIELVGEDEDTHSYRQIGVGSYLQALGPKQQEGEDQIALVVAKGPIFDGTRQPGVVGGDSTARLIRKARQDDNVKALVLRVDSPGGSTFASEVIRRELELTRAAGKPVVASMGSVAASGGYWIAMEADEIWASPVTITGSIGIYAMFPTFAEALSKLRIHHDGVGTTSLSGVLRPERDLSEQAAEAIRLMVDQGYRDFITRVAERRGKSVEEIDEIARGRVWIGSDALELGLVDQMGGLEDAVQSAAALAELEDDFTTRLFEQQPSWSDRLIADLLGFAFELREPGAEGILDSVALSRWIGNLEDDLITAGAFGDPNGTFSYCFCSVD